MKADIDVVDQEGAAMGDLDGTYALAKIARVASECQESRSVLTKFANLYQAS